MSSQNCGIVGAGNSAHALASYLVRQGHNVFLYARDPSSLLHLETPVVHATGEIEGQFELDWAGTDPQYLTANCPTIFVCTTATAYLDVINQLAPYLQPGQEIVLFSSKLGGSLEVEYELFRRRRHGVRVLETDALFACRLQADKSIWIRGFKEWTLFSAPTCSQTAKFGSAVLRFFPKLQPAQNLIQRGLTDFGALTHALTVLVNMNSIDKKDPFLFYYEGFTPRTVKLLETLESEFQAIARAYLTELLPASDLLNRYYGCQTSSLLEAMQTVPNYRHSVSPESLETRYLREDVPCTLVPAQELARLANVETPILDSVISMASILSGTNFKVEGRHLGRFGWENYGAREIREWIHL